MDKKLDMHQQHALAAQKANRHKKKCGQQVEGGDSDPLLHTGETPPRVLHPALEPSAQERHGPVGAGPEEGHEDGGLEEMRKGYEAFPMRKG